MRRVSPSRSAAPLIVLASLVVGACTTAGTGGTVSAAPSAAPSAGAASPSPSAAVAAYSVLPVVISSEQVVGENRFVFSFLDAKTNSPAASPDRTVSVTAYPTAKGPAAAVKGDGTFLWSIPDAVGVYRTELDFTEPGAWTLQFATTKPGQASETIPFTIDVQEKGQALQVGQAAASVKTPVLADVGGNVREISSDKSPDPAFYQTSVDEALAARKPFVLAFATPAFCTSQACGPVLDTVKGVAAKHPDVTFINVEPYKLQYANGQLQPVLDAQGQLQPVPAVDAYGITTEPWTFVVDGTGTIVGSFEGPVGADELEAAVAKLGAS